MKFTFESAKYATDSTAKSGETELASTLDAAGLTYTVNNLTGHKVITITKNAGTHARFKTLTVSYKVK